SRRARPGSRPTPRRGRVSSSRRASSRCSTTGRSRRSWGRSSPPAPPSTATSRPAGPEAAVRTAVILGTNFLVGAAALAWVLVRHGVPALELLASGPRLGLLALFPLVVAASFTAYAWRWKVLLAGLGARPRRAAEEEAARLIAQPRRIARAFALGLLANLLVLAEYALLLAAFGLPSGPVAVVAAVFATGAAHSLPVPAAVGALEGAELWLFG